ncbi:MAG: hypothetical protein HC804_10695 [Anaerolineae bacterium]|nr:hypothetical protein [Anaerolineae bacterium]
MEQVMDRGRLQRGRSYARKGQVLSLEESQGKITAKVQGSQHTPYKITIKLSPLPEKDWEKVFAALAERPYFVAQLLAGEMPQEIEEAFKSVRLDLFLSRRELSQNCNCSDWADVCKHLAAVHYILAERFDEDPFLLFRLRGKTQDEVLASLGTGDGEGETAVLPDYALAPPLKDSLANFWQTELEGFAVHIASPQEPYPLLERLGEPGFWPESRRWLIKAYDGVSETAVQIAFQSEASLNETD